MRKLSVFETTSLDGYFSDPEGNSRWMHSADDDPEFRGFVAGNASGGGELMFGRVTYDEMMAFWPTPAAAKQFPEVARAMNERPKLVVSRQLSKPTWNNTRLICDTNLAGRVAELKAETGPTIVILGSGSIVAQLTEAGLVDEFQIVGFPIILGAGKSLFAGVTRHIKLDRVSTRAFGNGNVYSVYVPSGR